MRKLPAFAAASSCDLNSLVGENRGRFLLLPGCKEGTLSEVKKRHNLDRRRRALYDRIHRPPRLENGAKEAGDRKEEDETQRIRRKQRIKIV